MSDKRHDKDARMVTIFDYPNGQIDTEYGRVTFGSWLRRERERFLGRGILTEIIEEQEKGEPTGREALRRVE